MKIHFQGFFVTKISERHIYFDIVSEMNFTEKHKGGIVIKD